VSYYAVALARTDSGWSAAELDLDDVADVDEAAERVREAGPDDAEVALLFVEADDEYLVVLRLDEDDDFRVFGSDAAFATDSRIGEMLIGDLEPVRVPAKAANELEEINEEEDEGDIEVLAGLEQELDDDSEDDELDEDLDDGLHEGEAGSGDEPSDREEKPAKARTSAADDDDDQPEGAREVAVAGEAVGDAGLLLDLGTGASQLLELCAHEGMLPSDVIAEVCGRAGCGEEYEELRDSATL
jgi:putative tRNA adenosine deaminase-associated protein